VKAIVRLMSVPEEKRDPGWVKEALRAAVQLELSTIPPYLYAAWSIAPTTDPADPADPDGCQRTIIDIAVEEMLHMGIACNLLVGVGGTPDIVALAPTYPAQLPMHVHDGLIVSLAPLSRDVLLRTFMAIEEPLAHLVVDDEFVPSHSVLIGQFYEHLLSTMEVTRTAFSTVDQIDLRSLPPFDDDHVIHDLHDARRAVDVIRRQGEGTAAVPFEDKAHPEELAHFYQFGEIVHGHRLTTAEPFTYSGAPVRMPRVRPVPPAPEDLPESRAFDQLYSDMLRTLERVWAPGDDTGLHVAVGLMGGLQDRADDVIAKGFGPAFRMVDAVVPEPVPVPVPVANRLGQVTQILDAAVGPGEFGAHGAFWRGQTRDQLVVKIVRGEQLLVVGNGRDSNLVRALRGQLPFGSDTGTAGADFPRMPADLAPVPDADIAVIEKWIDDGCPDTAAAVEPEVSHTTGAFRPDPSVHVDYFRDLDDWSAFHTTPEVDDAINVSFGFRRAWLAFAKDATRERDFVAAISGDAVLRAATLLATRQQQTVETHYGVPVPLLALLDGYERFGNDGLPDDPLRPSVPRHNMNGEIMWFMLGAFAEACLRLDVATPFWTFMMRPTLCGLLNDGLFRRRFTVEGFAATDVGRQEVFEFAQSISDADLPGELRKRYVESGL
jgi:Ferritin-like